MERKHRIYLLASAGVGLWAILLLWFTTNCYIGIFRHALYIRQSFLGVDQAISSQLIFKLVASTLLCVFGISCIGLYLVALEHNSFLALSRLFFLNAGLLCTQWDVGTMFYLQRRDLLLWIKNGDVAVILFTLQALLYVVGAAGLRVRSPARALCLCCAPLICAAAVAATPVQAAGVLAMHAVLCTLATGVAVGACIRRRRGRWAATVAAGGCLAPFLAWQAARYRLCSAARLPDTGARLPMLATIVLVLAWFLLALSRYRNLIFYDKATNRRLQEANRFKQEIADRLTSFVEGPVGVIQGLDDILLENRPGNLTREQLKLLQGIGEESGRVRESIRHLNTYTLLRGENLRPERIKVSHRAILETAVELFCGEYGIPASQVELRHGNREEYVWGDPYFLMQAMVVYLGVLHEIMERPPISVGAADAGGLLGLDFAASVRGECRKKARRYLRLLNGGPIADRVDRDGDIPVVVAKNTLLLQDCGQRAWLDRAGVFHLEVRIPIWREEEHVLAPGEAPSGPAPDSGRWSILLISTMPEQIALIRSYLEYESYRLIVCSSGEEALDHVENKRNIAAVLIGATFLRMSSRVICAEVRKRYSMGQLPIILIRKRGFERLDSMMEDINDVLEEPFSQKKFLRKLKAMIYLKQSVEAALKSRVDLLQSQMDPHFIFNTISSIMPLCIQDPPRAHRLLGSFSDYLRGSLSAGALYKRVPVRREVDVIRAYLEIQRARFGEIIQYSINVLCGEDFLILPLLVEPLVENCVKHGRRGGRRLDIQVDMVEEGEWLYVQVADDGAGIPEEKMREIDRMNSQLSVGLANLKQRLLLYYNQPLHIHSGGGGTVVSFRIPAHTEETQGG